MPRVRRGITGSTQNLKKVSKGQAKKAHAKKRAGSKVTVTRGEPKKSHKSSAYRGYMTSPDWYKKRAQYFATPGLPKTCLVCGVREVDLHHLTYERFRKEEMKDLVPLCRPHHQELHRSWKKREVGLARHSADYIRRARARASNAGR